nr:hypothetical protein [Tanacetum cinerariifolium]
MVLQNQQLEAAVQQKIEANERLVNLNSALKDYRQQVSALKDEQDKRELIEDVSHQMSQAAIEFSELISRLDSAEKENDIPKYECWVLERKLEIRSRCADVANRQHQESMKRAVKLEAECQKLRSVVKKQITGSNDKRLVFMINRLCEVEEEENKSLKESMRKRDDEIRLLQEEFAQMSGYITWKSPDTEKSSSNKAYMISPEKGTMIPKTELEGLQESKLIIEDQLENQKLINEEIDHKLSVATIQINEANQKLSALKVELEHRSHCCEELEETCLDLQLQLASASNKDVVNVDVEQEAKQPQTIIRQLKAPTPPTEQSDLTTDKKSSHHSSLRDHMVAEDGGGMEDLSSPKTKEIITATETKVYASHALWSLYLVRSGVKVPSC